MPMREVYSDRRTDQLSSTMGPPAAGSSGPILRLMAQNGTDAMGIVSHAIRGSIRLMDEAFQTEGDGLCVLAPQQTAGKNLPFLFTQGQAILTRTWVPTQDSPGIRQTYEAIIRVPEPVAMHELEGEVEEALELLRTGNVRREDHFQGDEAVEAQVARAMKARNETLMLCV